MEDNKKIDANLLYAGNAFYVKFIDESREDLVFRYDAPSAMYATVDSLLKAVNEQGINILNRDSFKFFSEELDKTRVINESISPEDEALLEFEMFDVKRRDIVSFSDFLKNAHNVSNVVASGKDLYARKFQAGFMHEIHRDPTFKHPAFDNTYKSFGEKDPEKRKEQERGEYDGAYPTFVGSHGVVITKK